MSQGKEWWIKEIAALVAWVALWVLVLLRSATIEEADKLSQIAIASVTIPFATKELVGFFLRIRLRPP